MESLSLSQKITKSEDPEPATESNEAKEQEKDLKTPDFDDHNRTMVLQVDRTDLRLISPDRKVILLHKHHRDITTCVQGQVQTEHFGFISREGANMQTFTGYIFKCESQSIANDAVQGTRCPASLYSF